MRLMCDLDADGVAVMFELCFLLRFHFELGAHVLGRRWYPWTRVHGHFVEGAFPETRALHFGL